MQVTVGRKIQGELFYNEPSPLIMLPNPEITQSALQTWDNCRRKFHLQVNRKLEPIKKNKNFKFGDVWHRILGAHYTQMAKSQGGLKVKGEKEFKPVDDEFADMFSDQDIDPEHVKMGFELYGMYIKMFVPAVEEKKYRILGVECRFSENIPGTRWRMSAGLDVIMWDNERKKTVIRDHKSTSSSRDKHMPDPDTNYQGWDYTSVLSKHLDRHVGEIIFTATRKKVPSEVEFNKSTIMPSTNECPDTTYDLFLDALSKQRAELADSKYDFDKAALKGRTLSLQNYITILDKLSRREDAHGNSFVWNKYAYISQERQAFFWEDARRKVLEIEKELEWNMSHTACRGHYGHCPMINVCMYGLNDDTASGFKVRDTHLSSIVTQPEEGD